MSKLIIVNVIVILLSLTKENVAKKIPDFIVPCKGLKPDCLKKTVQETLPQFSKGIPELGVLPIDPLTQDYVSLELPGGFKVELFNGSATGLRKCIIDSVSFDLATEIADMKLHCNLTVKGKYKANGKILIVVIDGDGDAKIKLHDVAIQLKVKFEDKIRDGIVYYEVKDFDLKHSYGNRATIIITNLFKGNPTLSEAVLAFLNENWQQIAEEFGKPMVDKFVSLVYNILKKFFEVVPKDELFMP